MCGINGFFSLNNSPVQEAELFIAAMNKRISHRGPDDEGVWNDDSRRVFFGHRRLSIIDLSPSGHQPMLSQAGNAIVFNGEIYNYKEIKSQHFAGVKFQSESDTEVILLLYEKFGREFLKHLKGMFSIAIWDKEKEELILARDRSGKKPLYYTLQNGVFSFSSEIKSLLQLPWVEREADPEALYHFLTYNLVPPPYTMFKGIHKMQPAYLMRVNRSGIAEYNSYWEVKYENLSSANQAELSVKVLDGLSRSVDYRMVSDVPVGAFLSGGVDSSAVVALMTKSAGYPVKTYSIGFEGQPDYDELRFASKVAGIFGTDHHEQIVSSSDIIDFLPNVVEAFDEPLADATCIPVYFLSRKARENGTVVVLTGDGSDELFAGYRNWMRYIRNYPKYHAYLKMPSLIRSLMANAYSAVNEMSPMAEMLHRAARDQEFFWGGAKSFKENTKRKFLSQEFNRQFPQLNSYSVIENYKSAFKRASSGSDNSSDIDWMCYLGFKFIIPNYYLHRMDRLGMAHSIEIRTPFLDSDFVNLALSVPGKWKVSGEEPKFILKKSLEKILPAEILYRKKMGFNVPLKEWAGDIMTDYIQSNLSTFCKDHPHFNFDGLNKQVQRLKRGESDASNTMWTIYFLMTWFNHWMKDTYAD